MAWNRPSETKVEVEGRGRQWNVNLKGLAAGMIVVIGAAVAAWWLWPTAKPQTSNLKPQTSSRIKEVKPAAAQAEENGGHSRATSNGVARVSTKAQVDEHGIARYPGGARVPRKNSKRVTLPDRSAVKWKHPCEEAICTLIQYEPGDIIVGDEVFGESFVRDFKASLKDEIRIEPDDDWYQRQLKEDMIAAKKDLLEAMNRGENIADIMNQSRKQMRELFEYRENVMEQIRGILQDKTYSEKDIQDLTSAANKMLEERGCQPIKLSRMMIKRLMRRNKNNKEEK